MAGGRFELAKPTIGLVSLNSNSETHMTAICDARLIYGTGGGVDFTGIYMPCNFKVDQNMEDYDAEFSCVFVVRSGQVEL